MKGILCTLAAAVAMAQVTQPFAGYIVDRNQTLRPVLGIAGNFVLGQPLAEATLSVASSGRTTLAKTNDEVCTILAGRIIDRKPAPAGPAIFKFDSSGNPLTAEFPRASVVWHWKDGEPVAEEANVETPVLTDEIELPESNLRVRLPAAPSHVEPMGPDWVVAYTESGVYAVRINDGAIYQLPEASE